MVSKLRVSRSLRLRVSDKGDLLASLSKSSGEFGVSLDLVQMLRLLPQFQDDSKRMASELKRSMDAHTKNLPPQQEIESLLEELQEAGVIVGAKDNEGGIQDGFGDPWIQWAMISDSVRTRKYLEALDKVLNKDSIVLDLGAGTGIFSAFALMKGVKHVYAVEETASALEIPKILQRMGIRSEGRFSLIRSNSADAKFPRTVNVVVSELFGNDPLGEGMMATLAEIVARVDVENTVFVPGSFEVFAEIIDVHTGAAHHRLKAYAESNKPASKDFYDRFLHAARNELDFSSLSFPIHLSESEFISCSNAVSLGKVSLKLFSDEDILFGKHEMSVTLDAAVPVLMLWFRVKLVDGVTVSSRCGSPDFALHWSPILIPLNDKVNSGDKLRLEHGTDEELTQIEVSLTRASKILAAR